jgi:HSP20 family protein
MADQQGAGRSGLPGAFTGGSPFRSLQDEMDRMFRAFSTPETSLRAGPSGNGVLGLRVDIGEGENEIEIKADLPGVPEDQVEVTLEEDVLRIRAEKKSETERKERDWRVTERSYGIFERAIRMPQGVDPEKVKADFEQGVLRITVPKPPEPKPQSKRIAVSAGADAGGGKGKKSGGG